MNFIDPPKIVDWKSQQPIKYVQTKLNGYFCEIYRTETGEVSVFFKSRSEDVSAQFPDGFFPEIPKKTCIWGELYAEGVAATSVPTLLKSRDSRLTFSPFAMPMYDGEDWKKDGLSIVMRKLRSMGFKVPYMEQVFMTPRFPDTDLLLKNAVDCSLEGYVLKAEHCDGWYKLKPIKTCDAFVVGHTLSGSMTYFGKLRGFEVGVFDENHKIVTIASVGNGLTAEFKNSCIPDKFSGRVMEVAFQDVTPYKKLQFPRFVRWRDDKLSNQCSIDQL